MKTLHLTIRTIFWVMLGLLGFGQQITRAGEGEIEYRFERMVPQQAQSWNFSSPISIAATDASVWVVDAKGIQHLNADGTFIAQFPLPPDQNGLTYLPKSIAVTMDQSVWVVYRIPNSTQLLFRHLAADGSFISQFKAEDPSGVQFIYPIGVALATDGSLWTLSNKRVQHFNLDGTLITQFGSEGSGVGQFYNPESIAISGDGSVWVSDWISGSDKNFRVQHFTADGTFIGQFEIQGGFFIYAPSIAVASDGSLWIANTSNHRLEHFTPQGSLIGRFQIGNELGLGILNIAISAGGSVWITDSQSGCLHHFNNNGGTIANLCSQYSGNRAFSRLSGITTAADNSIWVSDTGNNLIQHFSPEGIPLYQFGYEASSTSDAHIRLAADGSIWLSSGNSGLQHFKADGTFIKALAISGKFALAPDGSFWTAGGEYVVSQYIQHFGADAELLAKFNSFYVIQDLAVASDGSVWVLDSNNVSPRYSFSRIQHLHSDGTMIANFVSSIGAIALAPDDSVWVAAPPVAYSNCIRHFNIDGTLIAEFGSLGNNAGQFPYIGKVSAAPDGSVWVNSGIYRLQKFVPRPKGSTPHPYKAIVLAGGGEKLDNRANEFWEGAWQVAQKATKALHFQGFKPHDETLFLTAGNTQFDLDVNGKLDDLQAATRESLRLAITDWAKNSTDVVLYLAGQTSAGQFQLNTTETLSATELSAWLTELEQNLPSTGKVTVVIESPDAGSFMAGLANPTRPRIVIASTQAGQPALMADHGVNSFSYSFWSRVMDGAPLAEAFLAGQQAISPFVVNGQALQPAGDSNGDGQTDGQDAAAVGNYCLGMCNKTAAQLPVINLPRQPSLLFNAASSLEFNVNIKASANTNLLEAWALVQRPTLLNADPTNTLSLEKIPLNCNARLQCTGRYQNFNTPGQYRVHFYALDSQYQLNEPVSLDITIQPENPSAIPAEYDNRQDLLTLRDVEVSGQHYQAALQYQDGLYYLLTLGLTPNVRSPSARFDTATNVLEIPLARVNGQDYQGSFRLVDNYLFQLILATPN